VHGDPLFTGNRGSFAEYHVRTFGAAFKIPPSTGDYHSLKETPMNALSSKLTAFAAALAMNGLVFGALVYLFALQSHPNMSAIAFANPAIAHQWLS
jgi:hypothetical protein